MKQRRTSGFSLIELIVVMLLLTTLMAIVAPRLTAFFHGRRLDGEARRLWALTRYAREEAITGAVPVKIWLTPDTGSYGLEAVPGYGTTVAPLTYELDEAITVTVEPKPAPAAANDDITLTWWADGTLAEEGATALVLHDRSKPAEAWRLTRNPMLSQFTLTREETP